MFDSCMTVKSFSLKTRIESNVFLVVNIEGIFYGD